MCTHWPATVYRFAARSAGAFNFRRKRNGMFGRIKKWIALASEAVQGGGELDQIEAWAAAQGFVFEPSEIAGNFSLAGKVGGYEWRLQRLQTDRDFIVGTELRVRADVSLDPGIAIMLINRPLKEALEQRAFEQVTHGVQTMVDTDLPEEARWLALYDQVGWSSAPLEFWDRYAIVAETRAQAQQWLEGPLLPLLMDWPTPAVQQMTPFILRLHHGRLELRMEYGNADLAVLEHVCKLFQQACISAQTLVADGAQYR